MSRETRSRNRWEGPWQDPGQPLDDFDVAAWFAQNPTSCVADPRARKVIRAYEYPHRPWYDQSRSEEMVKRQHVLWWKDLRREVRHCVGGRLASLFANYLAGYGLVRERTQTKADPRHAGRVTPEWRRAKRMMKAMEIGSGPTARLPKAERLRTRLITLMEDALVNTGSGWKREFCGRDICVLWALIEETITGNKANGTDLADQTIARISRRSRRRND